jgi:2-keto-4-pentenoate hydratase
MNEYAMHAPAADNAIAERFVQARRAGIALEQFPGAIPISLDAAYRCQEAAIQRWQDAIAGWKVGFIAPALREQPGGDDRLVGPIFARNVFAAEHDRIIEFPVFDGGFAAVEAEFVFRLGTDAPSGKTSWTSDQAAALVQDLHIGIETAGSPLATINSLGPRVVVSDFGNNAGLLLGSKIDAWRSLTENTLTCITSIDGHSVGIGSASAVAGGLLSALAFALSRCARNGHPLRAGDLVTTGAVTGIHEIAPGQEALADFGRLGAIRCRAVEARAFAGARGPKWL